MTERSVVDNGKQFEGIAKETKSNSGRTCADPNVTRQTIIAIERNKYDPTLRLALKIAQFFEPSVEQIFKL